MTQQSEEKKGFILTGIVSAVKDRPTKDKKKTVYTYYVVTGTALYYVRSMKNGLQAGEMFNSHVNVRAYVAKNGNTGLDIWEGDRIAA